VPGDPKRPVIPPPPPRPSKPDLLIRPTKGVLDVSPVRAGWEFVGFAALRVAEGKRYRAEHAGRESCIVVLGGTCDIRVGETEWKDVGGRATPFDGPPHAVYAPPGVQYRVKGGPGGVEIAIGTAPARGSVPARLIGPEQARLEVRGSGVMERRIHHILMEDGAAESLLVTEVLTAGGHWSSYPPHKHDTEDPPNETRLEETYYHRLRDPRGFAVQRVYTADRTLDETVAVHDGELVLVPRGFHTVSAAPGYDLYYLNVMAGPLRSWKVTFDDAHAWLRG